MSTINLTQLRASFKLPTIVTWNRLEPRPRADDFERALRAEVRDALWMLSRQWQMGELNGEDGGSPVLAKIQMKTTSLTKFEDSSGDIRAYSTAIPLEAQVEQLPPEEHLAAKLRAGQYWLKLLSSAGLSSYSTLRTAYLGLYPIAMPAEDANGATVYAHARAHQWYSASAGRSMDGLAFLQMLEGGGSAASGITTDPAEVATLNDKAAIFQSVMKKRILADYASLAETNWQQQKLEYAFACSAPAETDGSSEEVLEADAYHEGHLDWYSFDKSSSTLLGAAETPASGTVNTETKSFIPTPAQFPGMPNRRWWEFEDGQTDLGSINANTTDTGRLLLTECAILYSNDWYIFPYTLKAGSLARVKGLMVTDTFGVRTWIGEAGEGETDWNLFGITKADGSNDTMVLLPNAVDKMLQGKPLEEVNFLRDEMANSAWAVESTIELESGEGVPGFRSAKEFRKWMLENINGVEDTSEATTTTDADIRYEITKNIPENWIPFIPVHLESSDRDVRLRRAKMLRYADGVADPDAVAPRSLVLSPGVNEGTTYDVDEEEVPSSGAIVIRQWQRTRWYDGSIKLWMGFRKTTGSGERSSGLKFDQLKYVKQSLTE